MKVYLVYFNDYNTNLSDAKVFVSYEAAQEYIKTLKPAWGNQVKYFDIEELDLVK